MSCINKDSKQIIWLIITIIIITLVAFGDVIF